MQEPGTRLQENRGGSGYCRLPANWCGDAASLLLLQPAPVLYGLGKIPSSLPFFFSAGFSSELLVAVASGVSLISGATEAR